MRGKYGVYTCCSGMRMLLIKNAKTTDTDRDRPYLTRHVPAKTGGKVANLGTVHVYDLALSQRLLHGREGG